MSIAYDVDLGSVSRRATRVGARASTLSIKRLSKRELVRGAAEYPEDTRADAPRTWADCRAQGLGSSCPCPYVSCKHNLFLDVSTRTGGIKLNFPDADDPGEIPATCALGVVEQHPDGLTLEATAALTNLTRERIRQIETRVCEKLRAALGDATWEDLCSVALEGRPDARAHACVPRDSDCLPDPRSL